jgi:hypothetical protein
MTERNLLDQGRTRQDAGTKRFEALPQCGGGIWQHVRKVRRRSLKRREYTKRGQNEDADFIILEPLLRLDYEVDDTASFLSFIKENGAEATTTPSAKEAETSDTKAGTKGRANKTPAKPSKDEASTSTSAIKDMI